MSVERGFAQSEFEARTAAAQSRMSDAGLAALCFTTEPEIRYFSGFLTQFWLSPTRPWFLVVPAAGKPVAVIPEIGEPLMRRTWLDDIRTWPSPRPVDDGVGLLVDCLKEVAGSGDVGMPMGSETVLRMPLGDFQWLQASLDNRFIDATPLVRTLRMVKSSAEIAKIHQACRIGSRAFAALPNLVREAMPLDLVFRKFRSACLQAGADDVPYLAGAAGAGGYTDVISPPTAERLQAGDVLMLDTGAVFDGYFCDFDRNFAISKAESAMADAYRRLFDATEAALAIAASGVTCRELFAAMSGVLGEGEGNVGRLGHGLGMQLTEWPSIAAWEDTVMRPGMVMTLEPAIPLEQGCMMVQEEVIAITDTGCRLLSDRAPRELPVI